jgi:hypothetical protein
MNFWKPSLLVLLAMMLAISSMTISCSNEDLPLGVNQGDDDDDDDGSESETKVSTSGGRESHRFGENCFSCHVSGGGEASEYRFTIAGSVYASGGNSALANSNATVEFYTQANRSGTRVLTLPVDAYGNFFTTNSVSELSNGLYPQVVYNSNRSSMNSQHTSTGQCYSCHAPGSSQGVIVAP